MCQYQLDVYKTILCINNVYKYNYKIFRYKRQILLNDIKKTIQKLRVNYNYMLIR